MTSRVGARLLTSVVVFCVFAELVALSAYYVEAGGLFYNHRKTYRDVPPAPGTAFDIPEALRVNRSSPSRLNTNHFGFLSSYSYDVALANLNNERDVDISMPSVRHMDPLINLVNQSTLTPDKLESLATIGRDKQQLADLSERILANRLASINAVLDCSYTRGVHPERTRSLERPRQLITVCSSRPGMGAVPFAL